MLVGTPTPLGTYTFPSSMYYPVPGAVFPIPFVDCLPGGSKLA